MIPIPPVVFDHVPNVPVIEWRLPRMSVAAICATTNAVALGCQMWRDGKCVIVLPEGLGEPQLSALRKHELAHCNGWPANHFGAR